MIPAVIGIAVHTVILIAGGGLIAAGIIWLDREIGRGLQRRR